MTSKILWLCSWYPNEDHPYDGDFIQRHAQAVAQLHKIDVLYVHKCDSLKNGKTFQIKNDQANLTEHIYFNPVKKNNLWSKFIGLINYYRIHVNFIKQYGKPDLIHAQIPIKAGVIALIFKWLYNIPYIVTEHYGIYNPYLDDHFKTRNFLYRYTTKLVLKYADRLTTVSHSLGDDINQWVLKKKFDVVPNVVDTGLFHFEVKTPHPTFQFLHISNMIPLKNVAGIIEATEQLWKQRQDFKLLFVGKIVQEFYDLAKEKKLLDHVIFFEGEIPYREVSQRMKESDALIIFSDTESQSCVVLESLCCGRPAIVTNIGGVKELIDEHNGYKVNVRDVDDLTQKMNLMMNDYTHFNLKQIAEHALQKYSYTQVATQFSDLYKEVM